MRPPRLLLLPDCFRASNQGGSSTEALSRNRTALPLSPSMTWLGTPRLYNERMLHMTAIDGYLALDEAECRELGRSLADQYRNARPFPHIVLDELLDAGLLKEVLADFPSNADKAF